MPSSRGRCSSYDCIVKIKGVTTRPILFSQLMRSDGEGVINPEELFADDCSLFVTIGYRRQSFVAFYWTGHNPPKTLKCHEGRA